MAICLKYRVIKTEYRTDENNRLKFLFIPILSNKMINTEITITETAKIKKFLMIFIVLPLLLSIRKSLPLRASSQR
jgi:hypothetical protein